MPPATRVETDTTSGSFRDPAGQLLQHHGRLLRLVYPAGMPNLASFQASATAQRMEQRGAVIGCRRLDPQEAEAAVCGLDLETSGGTPTVLEHERIEFPSYPYEWPAEMLAAAADLTLELAEGLLEEGMGLKDGTPFNVLFRGPQPVFVDVLSVEPRDAGDPVWRAYAQFVRAFLLPLLAWKHFQVSPDRVFTGSREGLAPEELYRMAGPLRRLLPPFLTYATLPTWLAGRSEGKGEALYQPRRTHREKAKFVLASLFGRLRRATRRAANVHRASAWSSYAEQHPSYTGGQLLAKTDFVTRFLEEFQPSAVLDVGCNTGDFSLLAARLGAQVVAVDGDPVVVGELWRRAQRAKAGVLPLVQNLAHPSPATGWRNSECPSFLERSRGRFDAVLLLAVLHHLLVRERVPLAAVLALAAELTRDFVLIEFIAPDDPMFRRITRGREELYRDLSREGFEAACRRHFEVVRSTTLPGSSRTLYLLRKLA